MTSFVASLRSCVSSDGQSFAGQHLVSAGRIGKAREVSVSGLAWLTTCQSECYSAVHAINPAPVMLSCLNAYFQWLAFRVGF